MKNKFKEIHSDKNYTFSHSNKLVIKRFSNRKLYENEIIIHVTLTDADITPKIIYKNDESKMIIYEYAGNPLHLSEINDNIRNQFKSILNILRYHNIKHNDISKLTKNIFRNILILNGKIKIIDFEYSSINGKSKVQKPKIYIDDDLLKY